MVGYHTHMVACAATDGGTIIYSSRAVGDYVVYYARAPYDGFPDLPVDYAWVDSYFMGTKDELYEQMELTKNGVYTACEIYRDYASSATMTLDLFSRCNNGWAKYVLVMPATPPADAVDMHGWPYPQPCDWHLASRRRYVCHCSYDEYRDFTDASSMSVAIDAMSDDTDCDGMMY